MTCTTKLPLHLGVAEGTRVVSPPCSCTLLHVPEFSPCRKTPSSPLDEGGGGAAPVPQGSNLPTVPPAVLWWGIKRHWLLSGTSWLYPSSCRTGA